MTKSNTPNSHHGTQKAIANPQGSLTEDHLLTEAEVALRQGRSVKTLQNQRVTGSGIPLPRGATAELKVRIDRIGAKLAITVISAVEVLKNRKPFEKQAGS